MDETLTEEQKNDLRLRIINLAGKLLGIPYDLGAEWTDLKTLPAALDCSELVEGVYNHFGIKMPDGSQNQYNFTAPVATPKPGDLLFFAKDANPSKIYHVGLLYDSQTVIEARAFDPTAKFETGAVILRPLVKWTGWKNYVGARAHPKLA